MTFKLISSSMLMNSYFYVFYFTMLFCNPVTGQHSGLKIIHQRIVDDLLENQVDNDAIHAILENITPEGNWPDIDYVDTSRTGFQHSQHLSRMLLLAKAYNGKVSIHYEKEKVLQALTGALDYWLEHDFICANWWWNQLGTPRYLVNVLLLMQEEHTEAEIMKTVKIIDRSNLQASGARPSGDRIKMAGILAKKLLVLGDETKFDEVIKVIEGEIKFSKGRGMQVDYSFHHRLDRVNNTLSYGLGYAQAFAEWAALVSGTKYQFGESSIHQLVDYYLDGICKMMVYGKYPDVGAKNRSVSRSGTLRAYGVGTIDHLISASDYRNEELRAIRATRLGEGRDHRIYNKFFWQSEYMSHQRPGFFASARMYSMRNQNMEVPYNSEGLRNHYLGDGANFISRTGLEYYNIFPVWDWRRIPGTTVVQKPGMPSEKEVHEKGVTDFVGGVTDGTNGAAAFDYIKERDSLHAKKSWFFIDDVIVAMGAGITSSSVFPVNTTINQSLLHGDVYVANDQQIHSNPSEMDYIMDDIHWVWHDSIGYVFPDKESIHLTNATQRGSWYEISQQSDSPKDIIQKKIFKFWLDHGDRPQKNSYAYIVIPGASLTELENRDYNDFIKILSNTEKIQAVQHRLKGLVQATFYSSGVLNVSAGLSIEMTDPGMIMVKYRNGEVTAITVSDPTRKLDKLHLSISQKLQLDPQDGITETKWDPDQKKTHFTVDLPREEWAGSSVVLEF